MIEYGCLGRTRRRCETLMNISRSLILSVSALCACTVTGLSQTANWSTDSNTGFSLQVTGDGWYSGGFSFTSPSGLWSVNSSFSAGEPYGNGATLFLQYPSSITYLPTLDDLGATSYQTAISTNGGDLPITGWSTYYNPLFWSGWSESATTILAAPDPTGDWTIDISASGPALAVPEPNPLLLVAFGATGLGLVHWLGVGRRRNRLNSHS